MGVRDHDYLGGSPGFSITESTDLDHYRAQPGKWTVDVTQLAKGRFGSRIRSLEFPGLIAYHNQWDCPALIHGQSPDNWLMIGGIVAPDKASVSWCGRRTDRQHFAATGDRQEIEFNVEAGASNVVVLMEPSDLARTVGEEATETLRQSKHLYFGAAGSRLIDIVMNLLARVEVRPDMLENPAVTSQLISELMRGVEGCFNMLDLAVIEEQKRSRGGVVHQAILHVHGCGQVTSALEMAKAAGVSQKTLELAFRDLLHTTPGKYLMKHRLNCVHHELADAERGRDTVTEIALRWGFTHMGRFARAYRELFGEHPSTTLSQRAV